MTIKIFYNIYNNGKLSYSGHKQYDPDELPFGDISYLYWFVERIGDINHPEIKSGLLFSMLNKVSLKEIENFKFHV